LDVLMARWYTGNMKTMSKKSTIYFDSEIHRALRVKAAESERSVSEIVNEAVRLALADDEEDLSAFEARKKEPNLLFEDVLKDLKKRGKI